MSESFLDGRVTLHCGDCLEVLATLDENSIDACVTDPPYHLTSIVKRFGNEAESHLSVSADKNFDLIKAAQYNRLSRGFMGKQWDGGDVAFQPETWAAVYRVLKPGAHLVAFGGTRTYHRLACAIEDAGFEIRDCISWLYGSGFPKSHHVSKGIDRAVGTERNLTREGTVSRGGFGGWDNKNSSTRPRYDVPVTDAARQWQGWGTALKPACELIMLARKPLSEGTVAANVMKHGTGALNIDKCRIEVTGQRPYDEVWANDRLLCDLCAERAERSAKPITPETRVSIAINDAEPISSVKASDFLADTNRPDIGCSDGMMVDVIDTSSSTLKFGKTITEKSLKDLKSIIETKIEETTPSLICALCQKPITASSTNENTIHGGNGSMQKRPERGRVVGRWPSNVIHDGSAEVLAGFPELHSAGAAGYSKLRESYDASAYHIEGGNVFRIGDDGGSAARFFYTSKADADDRLGSKHPTVKPLDLMQWLCRLVTPSGGKIILDPFSGTGTTGEAAFREGFNVVLIEREAEYQADIRRRMALVQSGPMERTHESIKAKNLPQDDGPLFGWVP